MNAPRAAIASLALLALLAIAAPFVAPCDPARADDSASHQPPNVSFIDSAGRLNARPVARSLARGDADPRRGWLPRVGADAPIELLARGDRWTFELAGLRFSSDRHLFGTRAGGPFPHLLGTDLRGRDLFARILFGARVSLAVAIVGVVVSFSIGLLVGGLAGCLGGRFDAAAMRLCELLLLLPGFYVLLALRSALPDTHAWSPLRVDATIVAIVSALWWAGLARAVRAKVLEVREREHVLAARALGAGSWRIVTRHLLPATLPLAAANAALALPGYVVAESGLSMIGLGIQEPEASWGNLLAEATRVSQLVDHPWTLAPALFLAATVAAFSAVGEALVERVGGVRER